MGSTQAATGSPLARVASRGTADLWVVAARLGLGLALLQGWGAYFFLVDFKPKLFAALEILLMAATYVLSPRGRIERIFLPVPLVLFVTWWIASFGWTTFPEGFFKSNMEELVTVAVVMMFGSMLTRRQVMSTLVIAGIIAILCVFVALAIQPDSAYTPPTLESGASGLRGAYIHKTNLATSLLLVACAVCCYERRRWARNLVVVVVGIIVVLSNSSAGLGASVALLAVGTVLFHKDRVVAALGRGWKSISTLSALSGITIVLMLLGLITSLLGKDLTFSGRDEVWAGTWDQIAKRPIEGWSGTNLFLLVQEDPALSINRPLGYVAAHSHNAVLELLLRLGIVGLVLYAWLFFAAIRNGVRMMRTDPQLGRFIILMMVIAALFAISEIVTVLGVWVGLTGLFASRTFARPDEPSITSARLADE